MSLFFFLPLNFQILSPLKTFLFFKKRSFFAMCFIQIQNFYPISLLIVIALFSNEKWY